MAQFTVTITDDNSTRLSAAINGFYPNWQTQHPGWTIKEMAEYLAKQNLKNLTLKWEGHAIEQQKNDEINNLPDFD